MSAVLISVFESEPDELPFMPLELFTALDSRSPGALWTIPTGFVTLDCGATASAGPETSVKRLVSLLRQVDPAMKVAIAPAKRQMGASCLPDHP